MWSRIFGVYLEVPNPDLLGRILHSSLPRSLNRPFGTERVRLLLLLLLLRAQFSSAPLGHCVRRTPNLLGPVVIPTATYRVRQLLVNMGFVYLDLDVPACQFCQTDILESVEHLNNRNASYTTQTHCNHPVLYTRSKSMCVYKRA